MRRLAAKRIAGLVTVLFLTFGAKSLAGERGVFPTIGAGARAQGMGGAFVAIADDASAVYWNPAGLERVQERGLTYNNMDLMKTGILYNYASFVQPTTWGGLGLSWSGLDASAAFGSFPYREASYSLSVAGRVQPSLSRGLDLSWGANLKYNSFAGGSEQVNSSERGLGCDFGLLLARDQLHLGLAVRDLYTKLSGTLVVDGQRQATSTKVPVDVAIGASYKKAQALWSCELSEVFTSPTMHLGVEYEVNSALSLRGGYGGGSFSAGLGVRTGYWVFDYAYSTHAVGDGQRFSVGLRF